MKYISTSKLEIDPKYTNAWNNKVLKRMGDKNANVGLESYPNIYNDPTLPNYDPTLPKLATINHKNL
jgi:hypothetical protein